MLIYLKSFKRTAEQYNEIDRDLVRYGYQASTTPGTVAGLLEAHKLYGRLPLKDVLAPVIKQASEGILYLTICIMQSKVHRSCLKILNQSEFTLLMEKL